MILRRVAVAAITGARTAWRRARDQPNDVDLVRDAFEWCVFAARAMRRAAGVSPDDASVLLAAVERINIEGDKLLVRLVRIQET